MKKIFKNLKSGAGITLVEVIVAVFIITVFFAILIADFPKIKRQFALARAVHKFSQDIKMVQDMALSGVTIEGQSVKGYGIHVDLAKNKEYIIYADTFQPNDFEYTPYTEGCDYSEDCDYVINTIDISKEESGVIIKEINNINIGNSRVSIDFSPPSPTIKIVNLSADKDNVEIVFASEADSTIAARKVSVNKAGLIEVK